MEAILKYIRERYHPTALILYGSYADGTNGPDSDFDALAIAGETAHDVSTVAGVRLDLYIYPAEAVSGAIDCEDFVQLSGGRILFDEDGTAQRLLEQVQAYAAAYRPKSAEELEVSLLWCEKMLYRAQRGDAEGNYRWHWLLRDSLEIFCDLCGRRYLGPKKALRMMQRSYPAAYRHYSLALAEMNYEALQAWVLCLKELGRSAV